MIFSKNIFYKGPKSDHFDGKRFFNPWNPHTPTFFSFLKWKMTSKPFLWKKSTYLSPSFNRHSFELNSSAGVFIGHASFLIRIENKNILIDPVYASFLGPVKQRRLERKKAAGIALEDLPPIDCVLISHSHYDHLDINTIKALKIRFNPLFITPLGVDRILKKACLDIRTKCLDWFDTTYITPNLEIHLTPAQHWSSRTLHDKNFTLWGGFAIISCEKKLFFCGDSGYDTRLFKQIKGHFGPFDLALIPTGTYKPQSFMSYFHMNPYEACLVHQDLEATLSIGMHFGTFQLSDENSDEMKKDLEDAKKSLNIELDEIKLIKEGETFTF